MLISKYAIGTLILAIAVAPVAAATAAAPASAISQAANLPAQATPDTWMHIMWLPANTDADPVACKKMGGTMEHFYTTQRCFMAIKTWLALAPGNTVGEECVPGSGQSFPVLMTAKDVQYARAKHMLPWTSADGVPFGYAQASQCRGK